MMPEDTRSTAYDPDDDYPWDVDLNAPEYEEESDDD